MHVRGWRETHTNTVLMYSSMRDLLSSQLTLLSALSCALDVLSGWPVLHKHTIKNDSPSRKLHKITRKHVVLSYLKKKKQTHLWVTHEAFLQLRWNPIKNVTFHFSECPDLFLEFLDFTAIGLYNSDSDMYTNSAAKRVLPFCSSEM